MFHPDELDNGTLVNILSNGYGADGVIITAASKDDKILSEAFLNRRKKGRVAVVGDVCLHINRSDIYEKELDFFISTSMALEDTMRNLKSRV